MQTVTLYLPLRSSKTHSHSHISVVWLCCIAGCYATCERLGVTRKAFSWEVLKGRPITTCLLKTQESRRCGRYVEVGSEMQRKGEVNVKVRWIEMVRDLSKKQFVSPSNPPPCFRPHPFSFNNWSATRFPSLVGVGRQTKTTASISASIKDGHRAHWGWLVNKEFTLQGRNKTDLLPCTNGNGLLRCTV